MSRVGERPIPKPKGVTITITPGHVEVKGPKGLLAREISDRVKVIDNGDHLMVERVGEGRLFRSMHGLTRSLIANMVIGVTDGFEKRLRMVGTGYRAQVQGKTLQLAVGFSHMINFPIPDGITIEVQPTEQVREGSSSSAHTPIIVSGHNKETVGETAAAIRRVRKPEAYEPSKGIRYEGEHVRMLPKKARV
jgi:large subunit ribosomal protein L6